MKNKIKVSIVCITYNHEKYIRQALESFIMQKTNFDYEVLIGEDCSSDNTKIIIDEFKDKYPKIIKPIYRSRNIGIMKNLVGVLQKAKGRYISLCEGDDFFTDKNKLQQQVDFLDKNPEYSLCFHLVNVFYEKNKNKNFIYPDPLRKFNFTTLELLKWNYIPTNTVMYRNQFNYNKIPTNIIPGDWYLHLYHAKVGKIGFINKIMSSYRKHENGIWWNYEKNINKSLKKFGYEQLLMHLELIKLFDGNPKYKKTILNSINYIFNKIIEIDKKYKTKYVENILINIPVQIADYIVSFNDESCSITQPKDIDKKLEELKVITDSKMYKLWPLYTKTKKTFFGLIHKF